MKSPDAGEYDNSLDMLTEDQMPVPEFSDDEDSVDISTAPISQNTIQATESKKASEQPTSKVTKEKTTPKETSTPKPGIKIESVTFREEASHEIAELTFSEPVKIMRKNQGGKLLTIRIVPTVALARDRFLKDLNARFEKASFYRTSHYSEFVLEAKGKLGNPYTASDTTGLFKLCIPYQSQKSRFSLTKGEKVADGLYFYKDHIKTGSLENDIFILRIEPLSDKIKVIPALANEGIAQRESLSSMAKRYNAVAGINGSYFTSRGDPIGTLIINRKLISSPLYKRSVFGITDNDTLAFGNPDFSGTLRSGKISIKIDAVNQPRHGNTLVVFTPEYSRSTLTYENGLELVLVKGKIVGIHKKDALIPPDGVVISAGGEKASALSALNLGQTVTLDYAIDKPWNTIKHAICGGPRILVNGKISINGKEEKFDNSITYGRHPRTAVALTYEGDLLLVVVDGRTKRSAGMKLSELGDYLKKLGVIHAINLDGGGSTAMYLRGKIVNHPSDGGRERRISNGILVTNR